MNKLYFLPLAAAMLAACASQKSRQIDANTSATTLVEQNNEKANTEYTDDNMTTAEQINTFGINLFSRLNDANSESFVCSPLGVTYVLAMLDNGATGTGKQEIESALGIGETAINDFASKLITNSEAQKSSADFSIANYLALNKDFSLKSNFKHKMSEYYRAGVDNLDFSSPAALQTINNWCSKNTGGMIQKFLDSLEPQARAIVLNALYFNGEWQDKFKTSDTSKATFTSEDSSKRQVDMMYQKTKLDYAENDTVQLLSLNYSKFCYKMIIALPKSGKTLSDAISYLKTTSIRDINSMSSEYRVSTFLPKFTTETRTDLNATLQAIGVNAIFSDGSSLSEISKENVVVSKVLQKAKIEVSEEGTKAAAVTGAIMLTSAMPHPVPTAIFRADHPFVYMIVDDRSGAILFAGAYK